MKTGIKPGRVFQSNWVGYVVAIGAVALATWFKEMAQPNVIPADVPILYIIAIVPIAIFFGLGPAILTCVLSALAYNYYFISPTNSFTWSISEAPILAIFLAVGAIISLLESNLKKKREEADTEVVVRKQAEAELVKYRDHLEELVQQRTAELEAEIVKGLKIEEALRGSEERWSTTLASIGDAVIATDAVSRITFMNSVAEGLTGWSLGEVSGAPVSKVFNIVNEFTRQTVENPVGRVLREGIIVGLANHTILIRKDGTEIPIDDSGAPIRNREGKSVGVVLIFRDITERKKADRALSESRDQLDLALSSAKMGTFIWDIINNKRIWDKNVHRLMGTKADSFSGRAEEFLAIVHPEDRLKVQANLDRAIETTIYDTEYRVIWPDGSIHYIAARGKVHRDNAGHAIRMTAICWDTTERKKAEEELFRANRELLAIYECNKAMVRAIDEEGLLKDVCSIMCDVAGYRMAWVGMVEHNHDKSVRPVAWGGAENGYLAKSAITWADTERGRGPTGLAARTGKTSFFQDFNTEPLASPWREAALDRGFHSSIAIPLFDVNGSVLAVFTLYADRPNSFIPAEVELLENLAEDLAFGIRVLRERAMHQQAEEALRDSEEKLRLHAENSPLAIVEWDADFIVTRWAGAAEAMFGWKASETIGRPIADLNMIYKPDIPIVEATMVKLTDGVSRTVTSSNRNVTKDGRIIWCTWYNSVLYDSGGKMMSVMSEVEDVTEHRRIDQAKDEFISLVSHELRNPLTVILGSVQTALSPGLSADEIKFLLQNAAEGGHSMEQIIANLLELSRYQANRLTLAREQVDVALLAQKAVERVKLFHPLHRYYFDIDSKFPLVSADPVRIELILYNLVENAAKYSPHESEIRVKIERGEKGVAISVKDQGIGVPAERISELFEPFQRLVDQSEHAKGLGLGLVVCKRLVEAHGGKIWAESAAHKGSTFYFTLPLGERLS